MAPLAMHKAAGKEPLQPMPHELNGLHEQGVWCPLAHPVLWLGT